MSTDYRNPVGRALAILAAILLWVGATAEATAEVVLGDNLCHAVSVTPAPKNAMPPKFVCEGEPSGYQSGTLWLQTDLSAPGVDPYNVVLRVHNSRFDRLEVAFTYADGAIRRQDVKSGDFGAQWRAGGQIAFEAPLRDAPVSAVTMRFDRVASANLLRMRLVNRGDSSLQNTLLAISIAAALTLLLVGAFYNVSLALTLKRQFAGWQAAWAGCVFVWGTVWSQLALFVLPDIAGAFSAQICTALACIAITLAAFAAVTAVDDCKLPMLLRRVTLAIAIAAGVLGIPATFMRTGPIDAMSDLLSLIVLAVLISVGVCLGLSWRRGSTQARSFVGAWALPMTALAFVQFFDTKAMFWGGGSQLLILFAAAWQTLWLAAAASRSHARLRIDRDHALHAEAQAHELARRDPLTGLRNRRGFVEEVEPLLKQASEGLFPLALLVIDVDLFKRINDNFGHDAGDVVLTAIAQCIAQAEAEMCKVARLGGEEFAVMVAGKDDVALAQFAQGLCIGVSGCDHSEVLGLTSKVTVSIGVAKASAGCDFRNLYRLADEALYKAKREGRNRVVLHIADDAGCARKQTEALMAP